MLPVIALILVVIVLPFFVLKAGGRIREVVFAALGFVAAALPISVLFAFTSPGLGGGPEADLLTLLGLTAVFYMFSISFTLLFGVPLFLVLRRFKRLRWWSCALSGLAVGVLVAELLLPDAAGADDRIQFLSLCGAVGGLSGIAFWAIWRKGVATNLPLDSGRVPSA
jgi:hypothetical protein